MRARAPAAKRSVPRQQRPQRGEHLDAPWGSKAPGITGLATPEQQQASRRIPGDRRLQVGVASLEARAVAVEDHDDVVRTRRGNDRSEPGRRRSRAAGKKHPSEDTHGMVGELGLAEQALADLVVADQVEAVQGELTAQVGDEAAYHRLAPGPRHHRIGLYVEHRVEGRRYPIDGTRERVTELGVLHGPVGSLPLSESPGRGHRPALSVGFYVVRNLECTRTEMGRYLVGSPQGTSGQRVGWGYLQGFEEGRSFDGKAVGETASNSFSAHGEQARRQIVQGYPKCHCGNGSDRVVA